MNNIVLLISIVMVVIIVSLLGGNSLYNYVTFVVPLNSWTADEKYGSHIDDFRIDRNDATYPFTIHKITYNESDESVTIIFSGRDSPEHFKIDQKFTHEETFYIDQSFVFHCREYDDHAYLSVFKYIGTKIVDGKTSVSFVHYVGTTKTPLSCVYPDVIIHSIDALPSPPTISSSVNLSAHERDYRISYTLVDGLLSGIWYDFDLNSIMLKIRSVGGHHDDDDGKMKLTVPKLFFEECPEDQECSFIVLQNGEEIPFKKLPDEHNHLLSFNFTDSDPIIEIIYPSYTARVT